MPQSKHVNGWSPPYDFLQITSWIALPIVTTLFYVIIIPACDSLNIQLALGITYAIITVLSLISAYFMTSSNPEEIHKKTTSGESGMGENYCYICQATVHESCRHCTTCDKCVLNFDHHCKWLNNCVGSMNYHLFFTVLSATFALVLFHFGSGVYIIVLYSLNTPAMINRLGSVFGCLTYDSNNLCVTSAFGNTEFLAVLGIQLFVLLVLVLLIGELFIFHVMLIKNKTTTYAFLQSKRHKEQKAKQKKKVISSRGNAVIEAAVDAPSGTRDIELTPPNRATANV